MRIELVVAIKVDSTNDLTTTQYSYSTADTMEIELGHNAIDMSVLMGAHNRYIRLMPRANSMQIPIQI